METTETTELIPGQPSPDMVLTQEAKYYLHTAGRWATFLGIMGFIGTGIVALVAIFAGGIIAKMTQLQQAGYTASPYGNIMASMGDFIRILYFLIAIFYFFFSYFLYQFGVKIKQGTTFNDPIVVTKGLQNLKSHFKLIGITTIVFISLYILIIIGAIIGGIFIASHRG